MNKTKFFIILPICIFFCTTLCFAQGIDIFADGDTTPDISSTDKWICYNTKPTIITTFDGGNRGDFKFVIFAGKKTTVDFSDTNLIGNHGVDLKVNKGDIFVMIFDGTDWYCDISYMMAVKDEEGHYHYYRTHKNLLDWFFLY